MFDKLKKWKLERDYRRLMKLIVEKLNRSRETWEVDEQLEMLWNLGDHGDLNALTMYGLAVLMEDKGWYNLRDGQITLEECAKAGNPMAQFYLGLLHFEGRRDLEQDPVTGKYWMDQAATNGSHEAQAFLKAKYGA